MFIKVQKLIESKDGSVRMTEVRVNCKHISFLSENYEVRRSMMEGKILDGLTRSARFTDISVMTPTGTEVMTVVGEPDIIERKILNSKQLLRG